jgi:catecholate siderophore receptor
VPRHTLALWNRYDFTPAFGAGLGLIKRSAMYASNEQVPASNNVTLPGYTRIDSALFYRFDRAISFQLNVENLFDKAYYVNAHSNTNIMPGSPRAFRLAMNAQF